MLISKSTGHFLFLVIQISLVLCQEQERPNIIIIVADDLGWNDVGFHGSNQIPTPNIDALAYNGLILNNYYVDPICTPSRSALMTGYHPIHTGMQSGVLVGAAPYALPLRFKLLPEFLNDLGYSSQAVGKWHLGSHRAVYTPTLRGFESHTGYWTGHEDYYDHTAQELYGPVHGVIEASGGKGVPVRFKFLPEYLSGLNYSTHAVGKWHLGHNRAVYLPTNRGFESHCGYWTGKEDYYSHTNFASRQGWGYDFRRDLNVSWSDYGVYATDLFTNEAINAINNHKKPKPLFLYLAHLAVHSANTYSPLQAPYDVVDRFTNTIPDSRRRTFAGMLAKLDESVGRVVNTLREQGMLENSIIVFTTDNGGPAAGFDQNYASNWPLRGVKDTLWEGGLRGSSFVWSPMIKSRSRIANQMMNIQDWLPTLFSAAGGLESQLPSMDGINMWQSLLNDEASPRNLMLHNIDDSRHISSVRVGDWKMNRGTPYKGQWDGWYGPSGRGKLSYDLGAVLTSPAAKALESIGMTMPSNQTILALRESAEINCNKDKKKQEPCNALQQVCLFNITADPCETNNLAFKYPDVIKVLEETLATYNSTAVPPGNVPIDPRADPKYWDYTWTNYMDFLEPKNDTEISNEEDEGLGGNEIRPQYKTDLDMQRLLEEQHAIVFEARH